MPPILNLPHLSPFQPSGTVELPSVELPSVSQGLPEIKLPPIPGHHDVTMVHPVTPIPLPPIIPITIPPMSPNALAAVAQIESVLHNLAQMGDENLSDNE